MSGKHTMKATVAEFESRFEEFMEKARQEPVIIEKNGRGYVVLVSVDEFERLQAIDDFVWATRAQEAEESGFIGSDKAMALLNGRSNQE